jgi:two-component system LytT family response regulator
MRAVIVDDDVHARSRLLHLCGRVADISVVAQAECGAAGIEAIQSCRPELLLLDIELRDMSGFDVLRSRDVCKDILVIMVTAHAEHALDAFEHEVVDYLTKPVEEQRFFDAIERARRRRSASAGWEDTEGVQGAQWTGAIATREPRILAEKAQRLYFIEATTVEYIECDGNYVMIHTGSDTYISRNTLKCMAQALAPLGFMRIDRSLLINLRRVIFAERLRQRGEIEFMLHSGARLVSGGGYRKVIVQALRQGLRHF